MWCENECKKLNVNEEFSNSICSKLCKFYHVGFFREEEKPIHLETFEEKLEEFKENLLLKTKEDL